MPLVLSSRKYAKGSKGDRSDKRWHPNLGDLSMTRLKLEQFLENWLRKLHRISKNKNLPVTAFFSIAPKISISANILRVFIYGSSRRDLLLNSQNFCRRGHNLYQLNKSFWNVSIS
ncbi:hypothetical protein RND81_03G003800 [Saponaria officinalis]|uniref:Uncharacterized protein n=1 Tax=Saponaria officinalis TaxID=3572 RepID=A0AAW1M3B4_SAPOF